MISEPLQRPRFGEGELALGSSKSVLINCPFDAAYSSLFDAILFSTVCCGFMPRSALESGTVAEPPLARITHALFSCRCSIHDRSRSTGEGSENLARFNMPLELGMAMARRFMDPEEHDWLLLVPKGHAYLRFVSDLAAYDPATHDGSIESVILPVMVWLSTRRDAVPPITPREVLSRLPIFQAKKQELDAAWGGYPPWPDIVLAAINVAKTLG
ncbi:MAG: hypothetical protein ABSC05_13755 [Candidatus Solibacter sp.]